MPTNHIVTSYSYKLPPHEEALAFPLSDDLLFNWSWYSERNLPSCGGSLRITDYARDIRRLAADKKRGREFLEPLLTAWNPSLDFETVWYLADRKEIEEDVLVIHDLASLHHSGKLFELMAPDNDGAPALRKELEALADRFDDWNRADVVCCRLGRS